jgi:hypothetical protein
MVSWKSIACSIVAPIMTGPSFDTMSTWSKPAAASCARTTPGSAIENGPGPQVRASSPGGGRKRSAVSFPSDMHGLSASARHTTNTSSPPGLRPAATFAHRSDRVCEEHHAEAREARVVRTVEAIGLHVGGDEAHVRHPGARGVRPRALQEHVGAIEPEHLAPRTDAARELDGRVAPAAADVHHAHAGLDRHPRERRDTVIREPPRGCS